MPPRDCIATARLDLSLRSRVRQVFLSRLGEVPHLPGGSPPPCEEALRNLGKVIMSIVFKLYKISRNITY